MSELDWGRGGEGRRAGSARLTKNFLAFTVSKGSSCYAARGNSRMIFSDDLIFYQRSHRWIIF